MYTEGRFSSLAIALVSLTFLSGGILLTGCGAASSKQDGKSPILQGMVRGGQQPVSGASIQLYSAGATGYGSAATGLLTSTVNTDAKGNFAITGLYHCPSSDTQVFLVATGGNPGLSPGTNNPALALMAALGPCGNLNSSIFVNVTEVTTVASVYALARFMRQDLLATCVNSNGTTSECSNVFAEVTRVVHLQTPWMRSSISHRILSTT